MLDVVTISNLTGMVDDSIYVVSNRVVSASDMCESKMKYCLWWVQDIARVLIRNALEIAAKTREVGYHDLVHMASGQRREYHDDMTVIVFFFKHGKKKDYAQHVWKQSMSVKGGQAAKNALNRISSHMPKTGGFSRQYQGTQPPRETVVEV